MTSAPDPLLVEIDAWLGSAAPHWIQYDDDKCFVLLQRARDRLAQQAERISELERQLAPAQDMLDRAKEREAAQEANNAEWRRLTYEAQEQARQNAEDAERYRFLRSPLAAEAGPVQRELWQEMGVKLCREEAMDREVDAAMRLLAARALESEHG